MNRKAARARHPTGTGRVRGGRGRLSLLIETRVKLERVMWLFCVLPMHKTRHFATTRYKMPQLAN